VDMVFLTGGSSFVPAVRRIFEMRFGEKRIRGGNEFTSVARGLALKAMDLHVSPRRWGLKHSVTLKEIVERSALAERRLFFP
jgi:molecular chaperone DnaK (HSP70)